MKLYTLSTWINSKLEAKTYTTKDLAMLAAREAIASIPTGLESGRGEDWMQDNLNTLDRTWLITFSNLDSISLVESDLVIPPPIISAGGREVKLPWTQQQYGEQPGHRYNIPEIFADVHVTYSGSCGGGVLQTPEEVQAIVKHLLLSANYHGVLLLALEESMAAMETMNVTILALMKTGSIPTLIKSMVNGASSKWLQADQIAHLAMLGVRSYKKQLDQQLELEIKNEKI